MFTHLHLHTQYSLLEGAIRIKDLVTALKKNGFVIADFAERRETIRRQVETLGRKVGGKTIVGEELLDTVTGLVEWPRALVGEFDLAFLEILLSGERRTITLPLATEKSEWLQTSH